MAEIKRYQKSQVFNQPVGVVRSTGAEAASRAWAGVATAGQRIFEMGYQEAKVQQKALGDNFAAVSSITKDDSGKYGVVEVPASFSPVARNAAEAGIQENYVKQFAVDVSDMGKSLYAEFKNKGDVTGFTNAWDVKTNGQVKAIAQDPKLAKYAGLMQQMMDNVGAQHMTALHGIARDRAYDAEYNNSNVLLEDSISSIEAVVTSNRQIEIPDGSGGNETTYMNAGYQLAQDALESIQRQAEMYPDKFSAESQILAKNKVYAALHKGQANMIVSNVTNIVGTNKNSLATDDRLSRILTAGVAALETGNMDNITDKEARAVWEQAGLSQRMFDQENYQKVRGEVANLVQGLANNASKVFEDQKIRLRIGKVERNLANDIPQSAEDSAFFLKERMGISSPQDLINQVGANITNSNHPLTRILLGPRNGRMGSGQLPDIFNKTFSPSFMADYIQFNPESAADIASAFRLATTAQNGQYRVSRGFSDETMMFYNELESFQDSNRMMSIGDFLQRRKEFDLDPKLTDVFVKTEIGKVSERYDRMDAQTAVSSYVMDLVKGDRRKAQFFTPMARRLIWAHGKDGFEDVVKKTSERLFVKSSLMHPDAQGTRYSPESYFNSTEMDIFKGTVATRLRTAENGSTLALGKNVGLVPDERGSPPVDGVRTSMPVYTLRYIPPHPKAGMPVMESGRPIEIGPNEIIAQRQRLRLQADADWLRDVESQYQQRLAAESKKRSLTTGDLRRNTLKNIQFMLEQSGAN